MISLRELILHLSVLGICGASIVNPMIGLFGYIWYSLARPDALSWVEGKYPHSIMMAICTLVGAWRFTPNFQRWIWNPWVISVLILQIPMILSVFAAQDFQAAWGPYLFFLKYLLIALLIPLFVVTVKDLRHLVLVIAFSSGLIGFKYGLFGIRAGGIQLESGLGGFLNDNNTLALALNMGMPFLWYSRALVEQNWQKIAIYIAMFTTIIGILITHSRAGVLTLGVVLLMITLRSKQKVAMLVLVAIFTLPAFLLVSGSLIKRMQTLENVDEDGSATARLSYARTALKVWKDYPWLGVGFGTYNWTIVSEKYEKKAREFHVIHNNYLQMAVDSGTFAFLVLIWQIYFSLFWLRRSVKLMKRVRPDLVCFPYALEGSLAAFALGSLFLSRTDYDFYYYLILIVGAWYTVQSSVLSEAAQGAQAVNVRPARTNPSPRISTVPAYSEGLLQANPAPSTSFTRRTRNADSPIRTSIVSGKNRFPKE